MKCLGFIVLSAAFLPVCIPSSAQQPVQKPAVNTTPSPAPGSPTPASPTPASASPASQAAPSTSPATTPAPQGSLPATQPASPAPSASSAASPDTPPATTGKSTQVSPEYVIGPEDNLQITVWKEPTLSGSLPVRPDGMISLALVGDIPAAGLNPMQLSADISTRLRKYINDPSVTVTVLGVNSKHIFLIGEVQHVGAMPLTPGITPLQAIAAAGGVTPYANSKKIYILRGEKGKQEKIPFNYKKALKDGNQQGITLLSGDTIVVP